MPSFLLLPLALLLVAPASPAAPALLVPAGGVVVGRGSGEVVLADLDRDGHLDLLTKHLLERRVSVWLGDGRGGFAAGAVSLRLAFEPGAVDLGDTDGDGIADLAVASRGDGGETVRVFLGDGRGGFGPASRPPLWLGPAPRLYKPQLRLADIDEDGRLDVVTANGRRNGVQILLGDGRGGFARRVDVELEPGEDLYTFAVGDVDGDGHLDLAAAGSSEAARAGRLIVRLGDGKGGFAAVPAQPAATPPGARLLALCASPGGRASDIVLGHGRRLSVLQNQGGGRFAPDPGSPYELGGEAFRVAVADLDGDGRNDLAAATGANVIVLLGGSRDSMPIAHRAGPGAYHLAVGDLDEDGRLDVVSSSFDGDTVTVLKGAGRSAPRRADLRRRVP